jgi:uncharacterized sporulation protein YeaH/YhbH (DUF444 family)
MTIIISDNGATRGPKDAKRHRAIWADIRKKALPDIILKEDIITGDNAGKKFVYRIPVIDNPDFRYGHRDGKKDEGGGEGGIGQGSGNTDDVIGRRPGKGNTGQGKGDGTGEGGENEGRGSGILTEATWEEILEAWAADIGLPNVTKKKVADEFVLEYRIGGIARSGPRPLLKRKETYNQGLKRFFAYMEALQSESEKNELECFAALKDAENHALYEAFELLALENFTAQYTEVEPFPIYESDDMRFFASKQKKIPITQAVVVAVIDVSASMDDKDKQYVLKSILFWTVQLLRREYKTITIRFVVHPGKDTPAAVVSEQEAFQVRTDGSSTYIFQGLEKALELFTFEYNLDKYDGYVFNFSDGDDFNTEKTVGAVDKLIKKGISMFGHAEIHIGYFDRNERLLKDLRRAFFLEESKESTATTRDMKVFAGTKAYPIVCVIPENREHIRCAITALLKKDRWSKKS